MARFRYKRGEKPLDGYTIEHGLGVGGFGEVYYAVSDSGREVALKAVQNYEDVELRGIRNCMNLKSPHLVTVFDVRHNEENQPFVIMEYVQGPSLRELLDNSPAGLGPTKSAFFLREIAKGLTYLHDAGVVHRDLKPHNVFYEDGFVKIGDYSLCKLISTSHRTGHTMTVGSVHYMAPEISEGRYDASVDIYALGIMLYEMLTGTPPYIGESMGEVLMKHMTAEPNLAQIDEPFRSTIASALAKSPDDRFAGPTQMVEAVFGADHVQNSVVEFNPQELTVVAGLAAKRVLTTPSGRHPDGSDPQAWTQPWQGSDRANASDVATSTPPNPSATPPPIPNVEHQRRPSGTPSAAATHTVHQDAMPAPLRYAMVVATAALIAVMAQVLVISLPYDASAVIGVQAAAGILASVLLVRFVWHAVLPAVDMKQSTKARLGIGAALMIPWALPIPIMPLSIVLAFLVFDWNQLMHRGRPDRLRLKPVLVVAAIAWGIGAGSWLGDPGYSPLLTVAIASGIGLCLQLASPLAGTARPGDRSNSSRIFMATPSGTHSVPVNQYSSVPVPDANQRQWARAIPNAKTRPSDASPMEVLRSILAIPGAVMFVASCILAVIEFSTLFPVFHGGVGREAASVMAMVGFGLTIGTIGFMVASGIRRGFWPVVRLFLACVTLATLHYNFIVYGNNVDTNWLGLTLPVCMVLFAWPSKSPRHEGSR